MRVLLDTQILIWFQLDDPQLPSQIRTLIENPANEICVSYLSFIEITIKQVINRLSRFIVSTVALINTAEADGFTLLPVLLVHINAYKRASFHTDHRYAFLPSPLQPTDRTELLTIFRQNVPTSFGEDEVADYEAFLDKLPGPYFVVERDGTLIGACGYARLSDQPNTARICWIFADPHQPHQGFGTFILTTIEAELRTLPNLTTVDARSSQVAYQFFEKNNYHLIDTRPDYWAPGLDLY